MRIIMIISNRCATGEAWQQVMMACVEGQQCDPRATKKGRNCGSNAAYSYFVSFIFFCSFLMLNLFVAVIMDNFDYLTRDSSILGAHHLDEFIRVWAEYDPNATGYIHFTEMYDMLRNMDPPLGFGNKCPSRLAYKKLIRMNMPITQGGKVNFTTTLFALIRENLNIKMRSADEMDQADRELRVTLQKLWPLQAKKIINKLLPPHEELNTGNLTVGKIYAGLLIHENWKTTRFGQKPGSGGIMSGQDLIARIMGAVRNSNTRASHASVEMGGDSGAGRRSSGGGAGGPTSGGAGGGTSGGSGALDSPHLASDGPDRRPSFSYLRRASERRRRLRMKERREVDDEVGSIRGTGHGLPSEHHQQQRQQHQRYPRDSESGLESDPLRKDSLLAGSGVDELGEHSRDDQHRGLHRGNQIYEDDMLDQRMEPPANEDEDEMLAAEQADMDYAGHHQYGQPAKQNRHAQQQQSQYEQESVRRQSINDRLTEAVTDVIEFVREESFKRGKRHSINRRRQVGGVFASGTQSGPGTEGELESEGMMGGGAGASERTAQGYRRRRIMRRSPRRSAQPRVFNDSDTGSMASMTAHDIAMGGGGGPFPMSDQQHNAHRHRHHQHLQQHQQQYHRGLMGQQQQRYKLQQHGGSVQDAGLMYGGDPLIGGARAGHLMDQHRRHQSADAGDPIYYQHHAQLHQSAAIIGDDCLPTAEPILRPPIQVGASPPPMVGSADADLVAARRKRDEDLGNRFDEDEETAIHVGPEPGSSGGGGTDNKTAGGNKLAQSPVRFIAPKVAALNSPSALLMPDEEIVPPDVPYRGRRLPQIPGSGMVKSAADFIHSSIYGDTGAGLAAAPLVATTGGAGLRYCGQPHAATVVAPYAAAQDEQVGRADSVVFPAVCESPTIKMDTPQMAGQPPPQALGIVKKQTKPLGLGDPAGTPGGSLDGLGSINFPRVSFSPTHTSVPMHATGATASSSAATTYHPGASMIATQAGAGAQSTVLASAGSAPGETLLGERGSLAWARGGVSGRGRSKKDDEDDWF